MRASLIMVVIFPLQNSEIDILPAGGGIALAGGGRSSKGTSTVFGLNNMVQSVID